MTELTCTVDQLTYGGKVYRKGDHFTADSEEDARLLKGWGKACDLVKITADISGVEEAKEHISVIGAYQTQAMSISEGDHVKKRRGRPPKYNRSDMRAED